VLLRVFGLDRYERCIRRFEGDAGEEKGDSRMTVRCEIVR